MSDKLDNLTRKKIELEQNLERIQQGLDRSIEDVKSDVSGSLSPKEIIKANPIAALGVSVVLGFLVGKPSGTTKQVKITGKSSSGSLSDAIGSSLKKKLMQRAVNGVLDYIEARLNEPRSREPLD